VAEEAIEEKAARLAEIKKENDEKEAK